MNKLFLLSFIFILNVAPASAAASGLKKEKKSICHGTRITPLNYLTKYKRINKTMKKSSAITFKDKFQQIISVEEDGTEICAWNKFLYVDFNIYFNRFDELNLAQPLNKKEALILRDQLYAQWLTSNKAAKTPYADHTEKELIGMSYTDFLALRSDKFGYLVPMIKLMNHRPANKRIGKQYVYDLLGARTPFNSIFPKKSFELLLSKEINKALVCINNSDTEDLIGEIQACTSSKDQLLDILGVLSSQRMYLLRDLDAWARVNLLKDDYELYYSNASLSSLLYFKLETSASINGLDTVYPLKYVSQIKSFKPYHFYSVAFIAKEMANNGFSEEMIKLTANTYAKKYKKNIKLVGVIYNILGGIRIKNGATGDKDQVIREQILGIEFALD